MIMKNVNKTIIFTLNARQTPYTLKADVTDNAQTSTSRVKYSYYQLFQDLQKYAAEHSGIKSYITGPTSYSVEIDPSVCNVDNCNGSSVDSGFHYSDPYDGYYDFLLKTYLSGSVHVDNSMSSTCVDLDLHDPCGDKGKQGETTIQTSSWAMLKKDCDEIILYDQLDQNNYLRF